MKYRQAISYPIILAIVMLFGNCQAPQNKSQGAAETAREPHRPLIHFTPDSMWMNDPNGMVYYDGEYHLFYQYHPYSTVWGPMHWGHAVSTDLLHWQHLPVALFPDKHGMIFSGSAVVDRDNTSGLGTQDMPPMVAIFTYHDDQAARAGNNDYQTQGLAFSTDRGRTWHKYRDNPVLKNPGMIDFRDPKVMWYAPSEKWIMALAAGDHIRFYSSPNLLEWTYESSFGEGTGAHGGVWECPDLFPLDLNGEEKWVLLVSINPGGIHGGSATQYFTGHFDGKSFQNDNADSTVLWLDYGSDNYAGVTWSGIPADDGRRIFMGWMSNWLYAQEVPTGRWRSAMTLPRTLQLVQTADGVRLAMQPVAAVSALRGEVSLMSPGILDENSAQETGIRGAAEIILTFSTVAGEAYKDSSRFGVRIFNGLEEEVRIGYEPGSRRFFIDRRKAGKSGFDERFAAIHYSAAGADKDTIRMHLLLDVASAELFARDGILTMTDTFFPTEPYDRMDIYAQNGSVWLVSGVVYPLSETLWKKDER